MIQVTHECKTEKIYNTSIKTKKHVAVPVWYRLNLPVPDRSRYRTVRNRNSGRVLIFESYRIPQFLSFYKNLPSGHAA